MWVCLFVMWECECVYVVCEAYKHIDPPSIHIHTCSLYRYKVKSVPVHLDHNTGNRQLFRIVSGIFRWRWWDRPVPWWKNCTRRTPVIRHVSKVSVIGYLSKAVCDWIVTWDVGLKHEDGGLLYTIVEEQQSKGLVHVPAEPHGTPPAGLCNNWPPVTVSWHLLGGMQRWVGACTHQPTEQIFYICT